jgi:methyltransferase-like protein
MWAQNFPQQVQTVLQSVSSDVIELEQYMDFVRNRTFRQTLLVHRDASFDRAPSADRALNLCVSSRVRPDALVDVRSRAESVFRGPSAVTRTTEPLVKAALLHLGEIWPQSVSLTELISIARSRVNADPVVVDTDQLTRESRKLAEPLLRCYMSGQVDFSIRPSTFTISVAAQPLATPYARQQASESSRVTNLRHESIHLTDLERNALVHLDGKSNLETILGKIAESAAQGTMIIRDNGQRIADVARIKQILEKPLIAAIDELAHKALLVSPPIQ